MESIILASEQMHILRHADAPIPIYDPEGIVVGTADPTMTPEFIADMKRRAVSPGPWYTGEQVGKHLQGLDEAWRREGPFGEQRMKEILKDLRKADKS